MSRRSIFTKSSLLVSLCSIMCACTGPEPTTYKLYYLGGQSNMEGFGFGNWYPDFAEGAGINQYDHFLKTLRSAFSVSDINGDGVPDRLVPSRIVWMQGEADAYDSQAAADDYRANIEHLMGLIRAAMSELELKCATTY